MLDERVDRRFRSDKDLGPRLHLGQLAEHVFLDLLAGGIDLEDRLELAWK